MNLNQVTVQVADVERSIEFYLKLGFNLIVHAPNKYARFEVPSGDATFSLHKVNKIGIGEKAIIYFECDNVDETFETFTGKGIIFKHPPQDQPWLWREARLHDPDDNPVILYTAGENRKNPPWRIDN